MEEDQRISLLDLPNEVLEEIVSYLPALAVHKNLRLTCRRLRDLCDCERICRHELIVWSQKSEPHIISAFSSSTRRSYNLTFICVDLKHQLVSTFFQQHGAKVRSLAFIRCKSPPSLLETIITHCDALSSLSIEDSHGCTFSSIDPKIATRPTVTSLKLQIDSEMLLQSPSIFFRISSMFPRVKHLNIEINQGNTNRNLVPDSDILNFVMNFRHLESLELDTLLVALLEKGPTFLDSLPKLKKLYLSFDWCFYESHCLWKSFTSRLNVSSIELCRLDSVDTCDIEPLMRVTGLSHLRFRSVDIMHLDLCIFKALVSSQLKMIELEAEELLICKDLTENVPIEANKTVTDLIFQSEPLENIDQSFMVIMTLFPTYFHGLVHLKMGTVNDEIIQRIFKYQKNLRSLVLLDCEFCTMTGFCGTTDEPSRNSITNLQNLEHLSIQLVKEEIIQSEKFQTAFDFPRLKYLQIILGLDRSEKSNLPSYHLQWLKPVAVPVNMFKICVNLEALQLGNFILPPSMIVSSLFRNSKHLNYLSVYTLDYNFDVIYVNLKHFYSVDLERLQADCSPRVFYYDGVLDRTVFTRRVGRTARLHSPKISSHEIRWISIN